MVVDSTAVYLDVFNRFEALRRSDVVRCANVVIRRYCYYLRLSRLFGGVLARMV